MNIDDIEKKFSQIQELREKNKISDKEYAILIKGLKLESLISDNSDQLKKKQDIYKAMVAAVAVAKAIV